MTTRITHSLKRNGSLLESLSRGVARTRLLMKARQQKPANFIHNSRPYCTSKRHFLSLAYVETEWRRILYTCRRFQNCFLDFSPATHLFFLKTVIGFSPSAHSSITMLLNTSFLKLSAVFSIWGALHATSASSSDCELPLSLRQSFESKNLLLKPNEDNKRARFLHFLCHCFKILLGQDSLWKSQQKYRNRK